MRTYTFVEAILALRPLEESRLALVDSDFAAAYKVNDASPLVGVVEDRRSGPRGDARSEGRKRAERDDDDDDNMSSVSSKRSNRTAASVGNQLQRASLVE